MATEKQIAANRANAKHSTGPKTAVGKLRSSRNALRHGLSGPLMPDPATASSVQAIAGILGGDDAARSDQVMEFAKAQAELLRIRRIRAEMLARDDLERVGLEELKRLVALDRYERYAHTNRRRAFRKL